MGGVGFKDIILFNPEQYLNTSSPIEVTELPMVTEVKLEQFLNALLPINVTELPMVTEVSLEQS